MSRQRIEEAVAQSLEAKRRFFAENADRLVALADRIADRVRKGGQVLVFGNGGSAADAQHFAGELVGRFTKEGPPIAALSLTTDTSIMTAVGNDYGYDFVFKRQIEAHARPGDVAVGISTSGNSKNVLIAMEVAKSRGLLTVGMGGRTLRRTVEGHSPYPGSAPPHEPHPLRTARGAVAINRRSI
jgi:D-sedoheptulose 7-phosphate isomerase